MKQQCSRCKGDMEKWKRGQNPVCQQCQRENANLRTRIKDHIFRMKVLENPENHQWSSWVCDCYEGLGFIHSIEDYGCFTCLKVNPRFKSYPQVEV